MVEWTQPIYDTKQFPVIMQREWVLDILDTNDINYDQVLIVDADTIVHPNCPNFFNETNGKYAAIVNNGCYEWVMRSINEWHAAMFSNENIIKPWNYLNTGFVIINKRHKPFLEKIKEFYINNFQEIRTHQERIKASTGQTIINFLLQKYNIEVTKLNECYNLQDLFRKNLLHIPNHSWFSDTLHFIKAGWVYHFNAIPQNTRHVDYWMERTYKQLYETNSIKLTNEYNPISLDYFLNMELANGGESKTIMNLNGKLKTVRDIVNYWKTASEPKLTPSNWQYYNCMMAGFKKSVSNHHDIGWDKMTRQYYDSLEVMTDLEIDKFLKETPVDFDNGFIKHGYHRAYAMIGRLVRDEKYIPFYMKTKLIHDFPSEFDGIHRVKKVTDRINKLNLLSGIDRNEYCFTQSSILAAMGIRVNDDLDIIISDKLKNVKFENGIDIISNISKYKYFGAKDAEDLIKNFTIEIDGYKFLEPRFYFSRKNIDKTERDILDWKVIQTFFESGGHQGYPFNFDFYKWGVTFVDKIQISQLDLNKFDLIKDKYNRIVNGINQGRAVYYNKIDDTYIKIFNPNYCRLNNFQSAITSGIFNGLVPALSKLIYDNDVLIGYIMYSGELIANNDYEFEKIPNHFIKVVLQNCKLRNKIYYDLVPQNIICLPNGQYSLIDLESVYDFNQENLMMQHNAIYKPNNLLQQIQSI